MFAVTGFFGQTGSALSETLPVAHKNIRLLVRRDDAQATAWRARGAEVVVVDLSNTALLAQTLQGVDGAYLLNPPAYMHNDLFTHAHIVHIVHKSLIEAANLAKEPNVIALSFVGAHQPRGTGNILTTWDFEQQLQQLNSRLTILRAANFVENWAWSLAPALERGVLPSMFLPIEKAIPMVSVADIGRTAAAYLMQPPDRNQIIELPAPQDYSPVHAAHVLSEVLGKNIASFVAPESTWPEEFRGSGFPPVTVQAFCGMFRGFNDDTIVFEGIHTTIPGTTDLKTALGNLLSRSHGIH